MGSSGGCRCYSRPLWRRWWMQEVLLERMSRGKEGPGINSCWIKEPDLGGLDAAWTGVGRYGGEGGVVTLSHEHETSQLTYFVNLLSYDERPNYEGLGTPIFYNYKRNGHLCHTKPITKKTSKPSTTDRLPGGLHYYNLRSQTTRKRTLWAGHDAGVKHVLYRRRVLLRVRV